MNARIEALRQKLQQLRASHEAGALDAGGYEAARREIERELSELLLAEAPDPRATAVATGAAALPRASRTLWAGLSAFVLVVAGIGYSLTGSPGAIGLGPQAAGAAADGVPTTPEEVDALLARMAERLKEAPEDLTGWTLLARAYTSRGRYADAVPAYRRALEIGGPDPDLMADLADALAAGNDRVFTSEAKDLVARALTLAPTHPKSLALAGSIAFDGGDFALAVREWEKLAASLPPDHGLQARVRESIDEARKAGGLPPALAAASAPGAVGPGVASGSDAAVAAAAASAVSGQVQLDPALASRIQPGDTVFVVARAAEGPRMPLAVLRREARELPFSFTLDDAMAMTPQARLSGQARLVVSARVSRSGQATPQSGDLAGESGVIAPGTQDVRIRIDRVVSP